MAKNIFNIIAGIQAILLVISCNGFLAETSQDKFVPKTVSDYREFIAGEGFDIASAKPLSEFLEVMTDDVDEVVNPRRKDFRDNRVNSWGYYTWQDDPEIAQDNNIFEDDSWGSYYHKIVISNIILDRINTMEVTDEKAKDDLIGEALFLRAWSYFMLANSYADPYESQEQAKKTAGVPINKHLNVNNHNLSISPLADVYDIIISDLKGAVNHFEKSNYGKALLRPGYGAAVLLLSRVYLYMKNYPEAEKYATLAITKSGASLYDISKRPANSLDRFIDFKNTEILYSYGGYALTRSYITAGNTDKGTFVVSPTFYDSYAAKDKRKSAFFSNSKPRVKPFKYYALTSKRVMGYAFRLAEAYLNRAEAYAEQDQLDKAIEDLNTLRKYRIEGVTPLTVGDKQTVINSVRKERRWELCFEGHRWFDLRRWGRPELTHKYTSSDNKTNFTIYTLKEKDKHYTLPFPRKERNL